MNAHDDSPVCKRCGTCCIHGGPALHEEDLPLIQDGTIPLTSILALRPGERVYDQPARSILPLDEEILKVKGRDGTWTCCFYSPEGQACGMYDARPAECEALFCRDIEPLAAMYDKDRLTRRDVLPADHPLRELMDEHDAKCAPVEMERLAKLAREGDADAGRALKKMVLLDMEMRRLVAEKAGTAPEMGDFLFGRPLRSLLKTMNINVYEVGDSIRFNFAHGD